MNKCILALSTALTVFAVAPAMAQNDQAPATIDCTQPANANDPACMKNGTNATGGMTTDNTATDNTTTTTTTTTDSTAAGTADQTQTQTGTAAMSNDIIVPADRLNGAKVMSASDYIGKTVYDQNGNNIGEVNDLILSDDGQIHAVILGVGGFLGIGEKDVAVSVRSIKMMPDDTTASTTTATDGTATTTTTTDNTVANDTAANNTAVNNNVTVADNAANNRLVVETTKEALEAAPTYDRTNRRYIQSNQ